METWLICPPPHTGAGIFVTTVVAGSVALVKPFTVASRPFLRDVIFYMVAVFWTFLMLYRGTTTLGETLGTYTNTHNDTQIVFIRIDNVSFFLRVLHIGPFLGGIFNMHLANNKQSSFLYD